LPRRRTTPRIQGEYKGGFNAQMDAGDLGGRGCCDGGDTGASRLEGLYQQGTGFSFMAPGDVKADIGTFRGNYAGLRQAIVTSRWRTPSSTK
jgi:hypothetical protein